MKAITTKYLSATTYKGSRIKAWEPDGKSVTLSWDNSLNHDGNARRAVEALCQKLGWTGTLVQGSQHLQDAFVFLGGEQITIKGGDDDG